MKKGLALLLAASMAVSTFAGAASAATTAQEKFDALKAKGIFTGYEDGSAGLDRTMTRAEAATIAFRLLKLEEDAAGAAIYKDLKGAEWAAGYIGAATKAGILEGRGNGIFDPSAQVTLQELAKIMVEILDLEVDESATAAGADEWAQKYVAAAVKAGVLKESADYTKAATREALVEATYEADQAIIDLAAQATVNANNTVTVSGTSEAAKVSVKIGDAEAVEVEVVDGAFTFTTEKALAAGTHTVTVSAEGATDVVAEVEVKAPDYSATVIGAKKIEVQFGQAVDTAKVAFVVKNASNSTVNPSKISFADDKASAVLEFPNVLPASDYTITTTGVSADALTTTVKVEAEKVTAIEFANENALLARDGSQKVSVNYKVLNQYGEEVQAAVLAEMSFATSKGTLDHTTAGVLTSSLSGGVNFTIGENITFTALHAKTATFAKVDAKVAAKATVASVEFVELDDNGKGELNVDSAPGDYTLVVKAKDQYGNDIASSNADWLDSDLVVSVSDTSVLELAKGGDAGADNVNFEEYTVDGKKVIGAKLASVKKAGNVTIQAVSKTTGGFAQTQVAVADRGKVDSITLTAPENPVAGEATVKIPYTALDQFGKPMTNADKLNTTNTNTGFQSLTATDSIPVKFVQDHVKGEADLVIDLSGVDANKSVVVTAVTRTGKIYTVSFTTKAAAVPTVISATKDITLNFLKDASASFSTGNIKILDQYNREITPTFGSAVGNYQLKIESSSDSVTVGGVLSQTITTGSVEIKGAKKGSSSLTLTLLKVEADGVKTVANSSYTVNAQVVEKADITAYNIADIAPLFQTTDAAYARDVKVEGTTGNGLKVVIPKTEYTVTSAVYDNATGKLSSNDGTLINGSDKEVNIPVIVAVKGANTIETVIKDVVFSNKAKVVTTTALKKATLSNNGTPNDASDDVVATKESDTSISVDATWADTQTKLEALVKAVVEVKDQYGVAYNNNDPSMSFVVVASNFPSGKTLGGTGDAALKAGDAYNVAVVVNNSKIVNFKVILK